MRVRFRVNLGTIDARKFDLDYQKCTAGAEVDMPHGTAKTLVALGIAEDMPQPERPTIAAAKSTPEVKGVKETERSSK